MLNGRSVGSKGLNTDGFISSVVTFFSSFAQSQIHWSDPSQGYNLVA